MAKENRVIGENICPLCQGKGKLPVWLAPPPCIPDCAPNLRAYPQSDGMYWLCFTHVEPVPTLWTDQNRELCLKELAQKAVQQKCGIVGK